MANNLDNLYDTADAIVTKLRTALAGYTVERAGERLHSVDQLYEALPAVWVSPGDMAADVANRGSHFFIDQTWLIALVLTTAETRIDAGPVLGTIIYQLDNWAPAGDRARLLTFSGASVPEYDRGQVLYPLTFNTRLPIISKRT